MSTSRSTTLLATTSTLGLAAATLMFALPGEAAPDPTTYAAEAAGQVWRVNRLDLDMSGDPALVDLDVASVAGQTGSTAAPDRSVSSARNLVGDPAPADAKSVVSTATSTQDTVGTVTGAGAAGTVPGVLDHEASTLLARSRWGGDTSCLTPTTPLTFSSVSTEETGIVPAAIPVGQAPDNSIPIPTQIPTELPSEAPSDFPTELPSDLPSPTLPTITGSPTLPTDVPTTGLPTDLPSTGLPTDTPSTGLPTDLPSTGLPTDLPTSIIPTPTLPIRPAAVAQRAEGDVSMMEVAPASVEQKTFLESGTTATSRRVASQVVGSLEDPDAPVAEFFGGEASLMMLGEPTLTAYSTGRENGSQIDWTPPPMALTVDDTDYEVPTDGTALALPYSQNEDVVLTLSAGRLSSAESPTGTLAQAVVTTLNVIIKNGDDVVLDAELFPMSVKAAAPTGGVDCTPVVVPPTAKDAGLALKGKNNGPKADKLTVLAKPIASGAKVTVYKKDGKKLKKVDGAKLDKKGDRGFTIKDKNGKKPTTYVVKLARTELTKAATATRKIR